MSIHTQPTFDVTADDHRSSVLVLGLSSPGFAGVTATDYLTRHLECTQVGHVSPANVPSITPFESGVPRNHTRIYDVRETPLSIVVGELFVPVWASSAFVDAVLEWADRAAVEEIVVPYGVSFPHDPEEHDVFSVATDSFRDQRLETDDDGDDDSGTSLAFPGLRGGVLDGPVGELVARSLNENAPPTGVLVTPVHPPGPDLEAALLLIDALESLYGIDVDEGTLRLQSQRLQDHYAALADRLNERDDGDGVNWEYPVDRSYM